MNEYSVLWTSRHEMSSEQKAEMWGFLDIASSSANTCITTLNLTWQATADLNADLAHNLRLWCAFAEVHRVVAGVFPPVALEALEMFRRARPHSKLRVITPVSRQAHELRVGEGPIPFVHLRWVEY